MGRHIGPALLTRLPVRPEAAAAVVGYTCAFWRAT